MNKKLSDTEQEPHRVGLNLDLAFGMSPSFELNLWFELVDESSNLGTRLFAIGGMERRSTRKRKESGQDAKQRP